MLDKTKLAALKHDLKVYYLRLRDFEDNNNYGCGLNLLRHISGNYNELIIKCNKLIDQINILDPYSKLKHIN